MSWIDRLIYRHLLGFRTNQLLAALKVAYENDEPMPPEANSVIDEKVAAFTPPTPPSA
jgi:hypothetical protein